MREAEGHETKHTRLDLEGATGGRVVDGQVLWGGPGEDWRKRVGYMTLLRLGDEHKINNDIRAIKKSYMCN